MARLVLKTKKQWRKENPDANLNLVAKSSVESDFRKVGYDFLDRNPSWILVQGWIDLDGIPKKHSWIEKAGRVLDVVLEVHMHKDVYYKIHNVRKVSKFTKAEYEAKIALHRRYGPFVEGEDV